MSIYSAFIAFEKVFTHSLVHSGDESQLFFQRLPQVGLVNVSQGLVVKIL